MTRAVRKVPRQNVRKEHVVDVKKPQRLLDIFGQLQAGEITEDEAVRALEARRNQRYGRVGRFVEAITS